MIALSHNKIKLKKNEFSQASQLIQFDISNALNERMFQKSTKHNPLTSSQGLKNSNKNSKKSLRIFFRLTLTLPLIQWF